MWTGIIAIIAFYLGLFLASLLACAKAADTELETIRRTAFCPDDRRWEATVGSADWLVIGARRSPDDTTGNTATCPGCLPVVPNDRRAKAT